MRTESGRLLMPTPSRSEPQAGANPPLSATCPEVLGGRTGAYEWNNCARNKRMAAFATHKREEVSVEELRAMQYSQRE